MNPENRAAVKKHPGRARALLALVLAVAVFLVTGRNVALYGWNQGTFVATVATVPIAVAVYYVIIRRWSR